MSAVIEAARFDNADCLVERSALWRSVRPFAASVFWCSVWQIVNSFAPLAVLWAAMYRSLHVSYWLTLALAVPAGGFVVRIFIIQHDCGHGSFFRSRRANKIIGRICSLVTLTPFQNWRFHHAEHHRNWNNLDRRASGADIFSDTQTTAEYWRMNPSARLLYRISRHPLVCHFVAPPLVFLVLYRLPFDTPSSCKRERRSVCFTNLALATAFGILGWRLGFAAITMVYLPTLTTAAIVGIWLFAVQHRFDETRWYREQDWSIRTGTLKGTSWLRLPPVLQWFTGNIGLHQVHHFSTNIPNYRLEQCLRANPELQQSRKLTLREALSASSYWLWDEELNKAVRFRDCHERRLHAGASRVPGAE